MIEEIDGIKVKRCVGVKSDKGIEILRDDDYVYFPIDMSLGRGYWIYAGIPLNEIKYVGEKYGM